MTRTPYRILRDLNEEELLDVLQHILQLREEEDIPDFALLENRVNRGNIFSNMAVAVTASATIGQNTFHVDVDATGGARTVTFESEPFNGQMHSVAKTDASGNAVTVSGNTKNINGSATDSLVAQYDQAIYIFVSASDEWRII